MEYGGVLVGLGNPGPMYKGTRHNSGFAFISAVLEFARLNGEVETRSGGKFFCELWRVHLPHVKEWWLLACPTTFMNQSGQCVQPLLAWHKIDAQRMVVAHDDLDIPVGELRFKKSGGTAGHNGLKSIVAHMGTPEFYRLRRGIGRPPHKADVLNWVLGRPDTHDDVKIKAAMERAVSAFHVFAEKGPGQEGLEKAVRAVRVTPSS